MTDISPLPDLTPGSAGEAALIETLWRLVAAESWHGVSLHDLARESGTSLAALREAVPGKLALLFRHEKAVDRAVLADAVPAMPGSTARDRIFDVLMRRLDALQPNREGIIRLGRDLRTDPLTALAMAPQIAASMSWMLEAAEVDAGGFTGALRVKGLVAVWIATLRAWEQDDTQDLGATMAALDRALDRAERLARTLRLDSGAEEIPPAAETPLPATP
jgi:AcrR family transcriptional regulator